MSFLRLSIVALLGLVLEHAAVDAIGVGALHKSVQLKEWAEQGLLADGTAMNLPESVYTDTLAKEVSAAPPETIEPEFVTLPLDHFGASDQTFENRFWVAESGYKPGGPVFIYDAGEGNAEPSALFRLQNVTSFFKQIVDELGGIGIVWEHRYYGASLPFKINLDTPASKFQYLTTAQALADVPSFAANFSRDNIDADLTPASTPWVFVGGSYPGMRAAFMRDQYKDTIFASYASSAPVQARRDMSIYFDPIPLGMRKWGFGNCTADIIAAIGHMDELMEDPESAADLKIKFLGRGADKNSNAGFGDSLQSIFWLWQSYGVDGGAYDLRHFCDFVETDPTTNKTAPAAGWAKTKGAEWVVDRWASWPWFSTIASSYFDTTCEGPKKGKGPVPECDLEKRFAAPDMISWTYQYCTEWGFFQSANLGPDQVVSKWSSLKHQRDICHRQFIDPSADKFLPAWPLAGKTNKEHGGWKIRPSNTYWSGGEFDPWRTLSPLSSEGFAPHPELIQTPPKCNVATDESQIFGYVMEDACHCFDFRTYFPGGAPSRKLFTSALKSWLPCFKGSKQ